MEKKRAMPSRSGGLDLSSLRSSRSFLLPKRSQAGKVNILQDFPVSLDAEQKQTFQAQKDQVEGKAWIDRERMASRWEKDYGLVPLAQRAPLIARLEGVLDNLSPLRKLRPTQ